MIREVGLFGKRVVDAAVSGGKWVAISEGLGAGFGEEVDGRGKILLPGVVDAHVHFNEPGRAGWEGLETGSRALAAGGGTAFFDMPLNSTPPVLDGAGVREKRRLCEEKSRTDFGIWGGLTPDSLETLLEMADEGVIGFKAFMCGSGLEEFGKAGRAVLAAGMKVAAQRGLVVGVHAEDERVIAEHAAKFPRGKAADISEGMRQWCDSRPVEAELAAIRIAMELAGEAGAKLHVVHVTHLDCLELIAEGRRRGVDVTAETCPHYLILDELMALRIGPYAKCAPPLRSRAVVDGLWGALDLVKTIGSDHSPSPPGMKVGEDVFAMWGGIAGCQHGLPLVCDGAMDRGMDLEGLSEKWRENVFRRFGVKGCGIGVGEDADFFLMEEGGGEIMEDDLMYRHAISAYTGIVQKWKVSGTWLRGERITDETRGRFLRPVG
ncbi:MAG: allantoinase AllB [Akkermansiaceae bacterium]|nr:allantoinase AllB [Akkermansiaceae bacterium]MDP4646973.1 allantoinase AllB [Akkermansiaceae bacterium]MDP4722619.1 allantoinase AllB [Akkermansiaceae bacterium]MDP4780204.1 allantoinase AllB [Akkermansiaceae bacterium]MDP4847547.1 allantoinase AllB [Akkermansiaceae bacterium]